MLRSGVESFLRKISMKNFRLSLNLSVYIYLLFKNFYAPLNIFKQDILHSFKALLYSPNPLFYPINPPSEIGKLLIHPIEAITNRLIHIGQILDNSIIILLRHIFRLALCLLFSKLQVFPCPVVNAERSSTGVCFALP